MPEQFLRISRFADLTGIPRKNLIEYDKKGILMPVYVDEVNQYRYYSYRQLDIAAIIKMLRELGMSLQEIKEYINHRSPTEFIELCENQKVKIEKKIERLCQMDMALDAHISKTIEGLDIIANKQKIFLNECEEERIFISNPLPLFTSENDHWSYYVEFINSCKEAGIPVDFPTGIVIDPSELQYGKKRNAKHFFCKLPKEFDFKKCVVKPSGLHVLGYDYQDLSFSDKYYEKIFEYIDKNSLTIIGDGYEFYLFDELNFLEPHNYLVKFSIPVKIK